MSLEATSTHGRQVEGLSDIWMLLGGDRHERLQMFHRFTALGASHIHQAIADFCLALVVLFGFVAGWLFSCFAIACF